MAKQRFLHEKRDVGLVQILSWAIVYLAGLKHYLGGSTLAQILSWALRPCRRVETPCTAATAGVGPAFFEPS